MPRASWTGAVCGTLVGFIAADPELDEFRRGLAGVGAERAQRRALLKRDERLMGGVERDQRDLRKRRLQHDRRGLGIGLDVKFGRRRDVRLVDRAAHDDEFGDVAWESRIERYGRGEIRQRADCDQHDLAGMRGECAHQIFWRGKRLLDRPGFREGQGGEMNFRVAL